VNLKYIKCQIQTFKTQITLQSTIALNIKCMILQSSTLKQKKLYIITTFQI